MLPSTFHPPDRPEMQETQELQALAGVTLGVITGGSRFDTWR